LGLRHAPLDLRARVFHLLAQIGTQQTKSI
jgi:hypothetical protein